MKEGITSIGVFCAAAVAAALLCPGAALRAADWFVTPAGGGTGTQASPCSLQVALDSATDGDVIYLGAGSYTAAGNNSVAIVTHSLAVLGGWNGAASGQPERSPGAYPSVLDGEGVARGVFVYPGLTVTLDGLTVQNGYTQGNGAGVCATACDLTVSNCRILANYAHTLAGLDSYGGGLYMAGGNLTVRDTLFDQNDAWCEGCSSTYGGGLSANSVASVVVERCDFRRNDAWLGCGLNVIGGPQDALEVRDTVFRENGLNTSVGSGYGGYAGGAYLTGVSAQVSGCLFRGNYGGNDAGAMRLGGAGLVAHVDRCWFLENISYRTPGIQVLSGSLTLTNSVLAKNEATGALGGALHVDGEHAAVSADHVTFSENRGQSGGYAVRAENTAVCSLHNLWVRSHSCNLS